MTEKPLSPTQPAYPRTGLTPGALKLEKDAVQARSRALKDAEWYARRRLAALKIFQRLPLPTLQTEAWRRTDLRFFKWPAADTLLAARPAAKAPTIPAALCQPLAGETDGGQLVLTGGRVTHTALAAAYKKEQVIFTDFLTATRRYPELVQKYLGRLVKAGEGKFAALAETLADGGVFIYVPPRVRLSLPLHVVEWLTGPAHFSRGVLVVADGAEATVVHEIASPAGAAAPSLHAATTEVWVGRGARLTLVQLQSLGPQAGHFAHERARIQAEAHLDWTVAAVGARLSKTFAELDLVGVGATGRMAGFYFTDGQQHLDYDTQQNHLAPHTTSDLLYKGALQGRSRTVWQGMIYVAPGAQKADGYQANRNLMLSPQARADSIPGLEILADDVRCTHGATVGQLEEDQVFYLMSRGLPRGDAEQVLVNGFFDPVLERIPFAGVRRRLQKAIEQKMRR